MKILKKKKVYLNRYMIRVLKYVWLFVERVSDKVMHVQSPNCVIVRGKDRQVKATSTLISTWSQRQKQDD